MTRPRYDAARLEWGTRFAYSAAMISFLRRFSGIRPGMRVVELGCGSGFWGRLLARGLRGRGSLLGIDLDTKLVARARSLARAEGLALARYRVADATRTRLPAAGADLVRNVNDIAQFPLARVVAVLSSAHPGTAPSHQPATGENTSNGRHR